MNQKDLNCEYCKKEFTSISSLNKHKLSAKYCLKLQNVDNKGDFNCNYCNKEFTLKQTLKNHLKTCKIFLEKQQEDISNNIKNELESKDIKIKELEAQITKFKTECEKYKENILIEENNFLKEIIFK
jgi:uncharacterized Zn-finger protein